MDDEYSCWKSLAVLVLMSFTFFFHVHFLCLCFFCSCVLTHFFAVMIARCVLVSGRCHISHVDSMILVMFLS